MSYYAVYLKKTNSRKWMFETIALTPETAKKYAASLLAQAHSSGFQKAQTGIQVYENSLEVAEVLTALKPTVLFYN